MSGRPGRVGVLDVGCFSAHLLVVDGSPLHPVLSHKTRLRLDLALDEHNRITRAGLDQLVLAVREAGRTARRERVPLLVPFATSVIRDAPNRAEVLAEIHRGTGIALRVFSGEEEARLAYVAARHWYGWSAGPLAVLDVGGGTVEFAAGEAGQPRVVRSLPLGARTLARSSADPALVRDRVRAGLADVDVRGHRGVACSKVFQQLARLTGARPQRDGPHVPRVLRLADLRRWAPRLAAMPARKRARLPGISPHRAAQSAAGAVVAEALMAVTGHDVVDICPWSTREGLLLSLQDEAPGSDDEICWVA
ncbi:Ppx/GppA phosphatase family protein [Saccharothrix coeruleofusca]|uniref:Ppx/GppA phosphatase family protein n=1 Tax=Saccharothrix coeruleofusca TaxID=33919 RepID=UPI00166FD781|nr:exopolyphosphatase [Saccharothrix coeruleofusca]MBP2337678.1 exopolyphosphatase/guanosine-5'-triphosphate,3'-diphosphate pyrophosphatase [Saccharothrix coeruleofusca]